MLRVTTLHASSAAATAAYYAQYLTQAPGEEPGVWTGRQAAGLGLSGVVSVDASQALLEGRDPIGGTRLGYELKDRTLANGKVVRAVAGFDATFSPPKSLSVLWALTQHPGLLEAHDAAVTAALNHLERYGSTTRIRAAGGRLHPASRGLMIATFRQTTSRADDPQVHTHAVISGKVQTVDGRWLALDTRYLKRYQRMLGGLYQFALRSELVDRFGVAWGPMVSGQAEIVGVPTELLTVFSKRTTEVEGALAAKIVEFRGREGRDPSRWERAPLTREASADTRAHKSGIGVPDLRTRWTAEAADLQWTAQDLAAAVHDAGRERAGDPVARLTIAEVVERLSVGGSTWNRADVLRAVCDVQPPIRGKNAERWAARLEQRLANARHRRDVAATALAPYQPTVDAARTAVDSARAAQGRSTIRAVQARGLRRRPALRDLEQATQIYEQARAAQRSVDAVTEPAQAVYRQAADELRDVQESLASARLLVEWSGRADTVAHLTALNDALEGWERWATGGTVAVGELATIIATLDTTTSREVACAALAVVVRTWADHASIELSSPILAVDLRLPTRGFEIDL